MPAPLEPPRRRCCTTRTSLTRSPLRGRSTSNLHTRLALPARSHTSDTVPSHRRVIFSATLKSGGKGPKAPGGKVLVCAREHELRAELCDPALDLVPDHAGLPRSTRLPGRSDPSPHSSSREAPGTRRRNPSTRRSRPTRHPLARSPSDSGRPSPSRSRSSPRRPRDEACPPAATRPSGPRRRAARRRPVPSANGLRSRCR